MSKERKLILPHYYISVVQRCKKDHGCVLISKTGRKGQVTVIEHTYRDDMNDFFIDLLDYVAELNTELSNGQIDKWTHRYELAIDDLFKLKLKNAKLENQYKDKDLKDAEEHIDDLELQLREQYQLVDDLNNKYEKLEAANKALMELKANEMGEALSDAFNNFTVAVRNNLDKETILKYLRTHNDDKIKMLEDIKESLEDITNYLLKKGDITWAGNDKILDYIDCKIEQQKGDKNETN